MPNDAGRPLLVVVGSINRDISITCDQLPGVGETVIGAEFVDARGGKGANQAAAAAIAGSGGVDVALIGAVGDDAQGEVELAALQELGVDVGQVDRVRGARTGTAFVAVDRSGSNQIIVAPGANAAVTADRVRRCIRRFRPRIVLVSLEIPHTAVDAALHAAAEVHATTVLNPAPVGELRRDVLAACDVVTPNEVELRQLTTAAEPVIDEETVPAILDAAGPLRRVGALAITLGERGALLVHAGRVQTIAAPDVDVVDTTGAGDVFNGVLAARIAGGAPIEAAVEAAVALASRATESPGARLTAAAASGQPSRSSR